MPQILVNLSLAELQVAISRYVAEECEIEVNAGSLVFERGENGSIVGASFDLVRNGTEPEEGGAITLEPEPEPEPEPGSPVFSLINAKTGRQVVRGGLDMVVRSIHGNMSSAMQDARAWASRSEKGQATELKTTRGVKAYELKRLS